MKKVLIVILIYMVGLVAVLSLCARAEQVNKTQNNINYNQNR